jgi:arylsulfatase A-like enzyme/tetratricopeptide (TPR) repeat protein
VAKPPLSHRRIESGGLAAALLYLLAIACGSPEKARPANDIILITIDTWRADAAGFAGNTNVKTPFLDALASRGIVFTNAHAHNVVTLPSHTNILTGLYPWQHGVRENAGFVLDAKQTTIAELLHDRGFATGAFIGAAPLDARYGLNQGFDLYDDNYGKGDSTTDFKLAERPAGAVLQSAVAWWQSMAGRKRFMWIHLYDPHAPYDGGYLNEVSSVDRALSDILGSRIDPAALVIVTGDHGEALGDHGEQTHGLFAYESTLKVPLLVAGDRVPHRSESAFVRHIDIVPTILDWLGEKKPASLPGESLLGEVHDRDTYFESLSAALNRGWAPLTGVIRNRAKYIELPIPELYDLPSDPPELKNLVDARRRDVVAARQVLEGVKTAVSRNANIAPEEAARLRSLGYLTGGGDVQKTDYTAADDPKTLIALDTKMHAVIDAYERGDLARAVALAKEVVAARPDMIAGRELLAVALQQSEHVPEAIEQLRIAVASGHALPSTKTTLALLLTEAGHSDQAIALLEPLAPAGDPDVLNAYGVALADHGDPAKATAQFERVLAADPRHAPAHQNLGIVALRSGDAASARAHLESALALNPRLPLALNTLGVLYAQQNDATRAVDFWRRAVAIDPRQYDALYNIAVVEARAGHVQEARAALEQFIRTAPPQRYARDIADAKQTLAAMKP